MPESHPRDGEALLRLRTPALVVGVLALAGLLVGAFVDSDQFFRSWLLGWVLVFMITAGAIGVLMIQNLTGGVWGILMRRPAEAAARTMPIVALAFLPVLIGMHAIYAWSHADLVAHDAILQHKAPYLNATFFTARSIGYFVIWSIFAMLLVRWGKGLDEHRDPWMALRMRKLSAAGLLIMVLTLTFASVDWLMSLEPHWYSSMFGISFVIGCLLSCWAVLTWSVVRLTGSVPYADFVRPLNLRDLGNLMLAFVMLWAYTAFSQFLLIWYGNIREEAPYYIIRSQGGWGVVAAGLLVFHFFLPFFLLLMRPIKDRPSTLGFVAAFVLFMRAVDIFWIASPAWLAGHGPEAAETAAHGVPFHISWMDPLAFIALFALWFALYLGNLGKRSLLPQYEIHVKEAVSHV